MPIIDINRQFPPFVHEQRFVSNGQLPSAAGLRRMAMGLNTSGGILRKMQLVVFHRADTLSASTTGVQVAYMRTGEDCAGILHCIGALSPGPSTSNSLTLVTIALGGATLDTTTISFAGPAFGGGGGGSPGPGFVSHLQVPVTGHADNTEYTMTLTVNGSAAQLYWSMAEISQDRVSDAGNAIADPAGFAANAPIYSQDITAVLQKATNVRKHNAGVLFAWTSRDVNTASAANNPRTLSAAYGRISLSGASPPNAATAGWSIDLTNRGTLLRGVPITFWAYARTASGSTNNVRLVDQSGAVLVTLSSFGTTASVKTGTATISAAITGLYLEFKSDGANILELLAFGCVQYEA